MYSNKSRLLPKVTAHSALFFLLNLYKPKPPKLFNSSFKAVVKHEQVQFVFQCWFQAGHPSKLHLSLPPLPSFSSLQLWPLTITLPWKTVTKARCAAGDLFACMNLLCSHCLFSIHGAGTVALSLKFFFVFLVFLSRKNRMTRSRGSISRENHLAVPFLRRNPRHGTIAETCRHV